MTKALVAGSVLCLLSWGTISAATSAESQALPTPEGLIPCMAGDPVVIAETRIAAKIGADVLSCFRSKSMSAVPVAKDVNSSVKYAFALAFFGDHYTVSDVDALLLKIKEQWKGFGPLSADFQNYTAILNAMIAGPNPSSAIAIKPVLVSIDRPDDKFYTVTSVREYSSQNSDKHDKWTVINSDAIVLRSSQLLRLTIQRPLTDPDAVAEVHTQIDQWARSVARSQ